MNWANLQSGQQPFSFGQLSGVQQGLYEDKPDLAYQQFRDWFSGGAPGAENTVFGRWLNSQQSPLYNRFVQQQAANPTGDLTWTKYLEQQANGGGLGQQFQSLPGYMRGSQPNAMRVKRELW